MKPTLSLKVPKGIADIILNISKEDGTPLVTKEEANSLASLKFKNGESMLNMQHRWFVYEIIWLLNKVGYLPTYNYLTVDWEKVFGIDYNIQTQSGYRSAADYNIRKKMMFENPLMSPSKEKFAVDMEIYRNKADVVEGGEKCRRCQSESTYSVVSMNKKCDEMQTIRIWCSACGYRWTAQ